ncbi:hypothetical protein OVA24_08235 [Luteolibacter sp. SL250]|uniref:hypothetical protein n=1 Tax=Luteolibacter sp. SL250 TaxID=2995170 RepID=UPI00227145F8|nr:hypothetical protein [Luteolibacter sp. SL250]WAC21373.1 hypothetical protein OVA24_08235 [Luteolibacter sp. SL250]
MPPLLSCALVVLPVHAGEFVDKLRESASLEIEKSETDALFRQAELSQKYVAALKSLEERVRTTGDLDAIIRVREEADSITKSGEVTSHGDKGITDLREKYIAARTVIMKDADTARGKVVESLTRAIREKEAALTKAGQVDEALAVRKEGEQMLLELSAGTQNQGVEFEEDARATGPTELKELKEINVPTTAPALFEKPFSIKGTWLESMTLPPLKQRISEQVVLGDRGKKKWPTIVLPKGTVWSGRDTRIFSSAAYIVATKSSFERLKFLGDLASDSYFVNCSFDECTLNRGGGWWGWDQASKYYLENCVVGKSLASAWNVVDNGFRVRTSVFEKVELPTVSFKEKEPANYLNHPWFRFENCRFVGCKVPSSFVLVTRDCIFQDCVFVDDEGLKEGQKPIDVVIYVGPGGRYDISKLPKNVTITRKPDTEWKGGTIPTAQALRDMMAF